MNQVSRAILKTLAYHQLFDYPLKLTEINRLLIWPQDTPSQRKTTPSLEEIKQNFKSLEAKQLIGKTKSFYFLSKGFGSTRGISINDLVGQRKKRAESSQKKLRIAQQAVNKLKNIPFIKMIGLTGALAMNNSPEGDDIDLLIISAQNRLWLTRLLAIIVLELLGKRRRPKDKDLKDKICLNMFLDEEALELKKRNLYTAHEVAQMRPVFNRDGGYERFIAENEWVKAYLPNSIEAEKMAFRSNSGAEVDKLNLAHQKKFYLGRKLLNCLERLAFMAQKLYMKPKMTGEKIGKHYAFFHPKDRGKEILDNYKVKIKQGFNRQGEFNRKNK